MIFANHAALTGLIVALTPIVIYLLLRRRKTEVRWGASYLLRLTLASKRKSSFWKQILVLAVRSLILALIALAAAQPLLHNPAPSDSELAMPAEPVHRVALVDNSMSMSVESGGKSRMANLKLALASLMKTQRPCDRLTLIPLVAAEGNADGDIQLLNGHLSADEIRNQIARIELREGVIKLNEALAQALSCLADKPLQQSEIFVLSDFPREAAADTPGMTWFKDAAAKRDIKCVLVNLATGEPPRNITVNSALVGSDTVIAGVPVNLYISASNCSSRSEKAQFEITVNGTSTAQKTVDFQADETRRFSVPLTLNTPGTAVLKIRAEPSALSEPAPACLCLSVRRPPTVWVLSDAPAHAAPEEYRESEFLLRALRHPLEHNAAIDIQEVKSRQLSQSIPIEVDAVVLAGVKEVAPAMGQTLEQFVRFGGGLLISASPEAEAASYDKNLAAMLPAQLDKPRRDKFDPDDYTVLRSEPEEGASALLSEFASKVNGDLTAARFYNYLLLKTADKSSNIVLRLVTGDPLLIHRPLGLGHVLLWTSSLGISWSSAPVQQNYVPLLQRLINLAIQGRSLSRNQQPGGAVIIPWPVSDAARLIPPAGAERLIEPVMGREARFLRIDDLWQHGLYRLERANAEPESFCISGASPEPDLRTLNETQSAALSSALNSPVYPGWQASVKALGSADAQTALWPWLLLGLLGLYLFETWLVRKL